MKWFVVVIGALHGQPAHAVDWRYPFETQKACEAHIVATVHPGWHFERSLSGGFTASDGAREYCEQIGEE